MHRSLNKDMCQLVSTAARLGEEVTLYGKETSGNLANFAVAVGLYYKDPLWWTAP